MEKHNDYGKCEKCGKEAQLEHWCYSECNERIKKEIRIYNAKAEEEIEHLQSDQGARVKLWGEIHAAVGKNDWHFGSVVRDVSAKTGYTYRAIEVLVNEYFDIDKVDIIGGDNE